MTLIPGLLIKNLIPSEPVTITKVEPLGSMTSIHYTGINTNMSNHKLLRNDQLDSLDVIAEEGKFNFKGDPEKFALFAEAERIHSAFRYDPLFAVNCSLVDPLPHQIDAVYKYLLPLPNIRFLLADDTGAGKTIMTGLLIKEMMMRQLVDRILIITPGGLTKQWQEDELGLKFNLPFKIVNRATFSADPNIFSSSTLLITSIDFIRADDVLNVLSEIRWSMVVVDEAHKLSAFDYGQKRYRSKRYQALEKIAVNCEHLLLLTATPHRGRTDTFKNLLQLLDEDVFASDTLVTTRVNEISDTGVNKFFIRRLKEQMTDWDGKPLFKSRFTKTTLYLLTEDEKRLYDRVTNYLISKREEAKEQSNIHVSLALMVMQRRLTSSIRAITITLKNRYNALNALVNELVNNPNLWRQRQKLELDVTTIDDYDDLDDDDKDGLEKIMADPRQFRMFTTAGSLPELKEERDQVKNLVEFAEQLYTSQTEEAKYIRLRKLLVEQGIFDRKEEKLVIFTEHRDTLIYLEERLKNNGYDVVTIHGGKPVEERRNIQAQFAREAQILIATDAAGEGINLQFCRLMINWDIPWNPNRLEQRMGRIHRYGQKKDVLVFNMVAQNTREGYVLQRLLEKLDLIREQIGDDRVYDVISDIFEEVALGDIIDSTFNHADNQFNEVIENRFTREAVEQKIKEQKEKIAHGTVDFLAARQLKDLSYERRLQPIYVRKFFVRAFTELGGLLEEQPNSMFKLKKIPPNLLKVLREDYNYHIDIQNTDICFDKQVFLDYHFNNPTTRLFFINPGNKLFDAVLKVVRNQYREDMIKGTLLVSPDDPEPYFAFLVKSQVADNRLTKVMENIADEEIHLVCADKEGSFFSTSPARLIDLKSPLHFAKNVTIPEPVTEENVCGWSLENITLPQFEKVENRIMADIELRKQYLSEAFNQVIFDITGEVNELQGKIILGDNRVLEKIQRKQQKIADLKVKRLERLNSLEGMKQLSPKKPQVMGCAYVIPLNQVEYETHFGMQRDEFVEDIAMKIAMEYEWENGWVPEDVSKLNLGYDIRSTNADGTKRYIEVKGRSLTGGVMISENEMNRLEQLGDSAWLYLVMDCKTNPKLSRWNNPAKNMKFETKLKGVQYFLPESEWGKILNS